MLRDLSWPLPHLQMGSCWKTLNRISDTSKVCTCGSCSHRPPARYVKLRVAHMPGMFSPPPRVSDPDVHYGTCATHVPGWMPGSLTSGFLWSRWQGNRSRHPQRMPTHNFKYLTRGPCNNRYKACISTFISIGLGFSHNITVRTLNTCGRDRQRFCYTFWVNDPLNRKASPMLSAVAFRCR